MTYGAVRVLGSASSVLILVGAAMFFALGLEPAVSELVNRRVPRWAAVTLVVVLAFGFLAGAVAATIPPLVQEARQFIEQAPHYLQEAQNHSTVIGRINERFHVQQRITDMIHSSGTPAVGNIVKAGETVVGAVSRVGVVAVLTVYFLADMRRIRATVYRFVPNSRRPRAILIGDEVMAKFGDYLFGNVLTSVIAGAATFAWCFLFDVPYALLLGVFVAIVDLFPYGSTVGGFVVALVALTVSIPVSIAHRGLLHRIPIGRRLPLDAENHRPGGQGSWRCHRGGRDDRRGAAGRRRRARGDSGRRGTSVAGLKNCCSPSSMNHDLSSRRGGPHGLCYRPVPIAVSRVRRRRSVRRPR